MSFMLIILSTIISVIFGYLRYKYTYWDLQGVKQLKTNFLFGNISLLKSIHLSELLHEVYQQFNGQVKVAGAYIFTQPIAVVLDLDLVKTVLIKDFTKFVDRDALQVDQHDPMMGNLFNLYGSKWRNLRTKLTPTFTSGKMKFMFPTIVGVADEFASAFERHVADSKCNGTIELYDIIARFTTDVIGSCVFGIDCNSLKDPNVEFRRIGMRIFHTKSLSVRVRLFRRIYTNFLQHFGVKRFPQDVEDFIMRVVRETIALREAKNIQRNDFMNLLIELKNSKDENGKPGLSIEEVAAQAFIFFAAGFETSSSNMSYSLFELAKNPEKQDKLRAEILSVLDKHDGVLSYDAMMEMTYLDQVINETLRKYPALASLTRIASEDYAIPGTTITLEKGTHIHIPVKEIHYDPKIYDNPKEYRPERFSPAEVQKRHPQAFLGFGDGPRNCIGLRFGRMQVRVGLITLLKSFRFSVAERTPNEIEHLKYSIVLVAKDGVWLRAEKL